MVYLGRDRFNRNGGTAPRSTMVDSGTGAAHSPRVAPNERFADLDRVLSDREASPLEVLKEVAKYQRYLLAIEERAVKAARQGGSTWEDIARAVGNSRQAAWKRWRARGPDLGGAIHPSPARWERGPRPS